MWRFLRSPVPRPRPIYVYDRQSGRIEPERVYRRGFMAFMYGGRPGLALTELIFKRRLFTQLYTLGRRGAGSRRAIQPFIERYHLDPDEFADPVDSYDSFNAFFCRRLKPSARPIDTDPTRLIAPGDGRLLALPVDRDTVFPVKEHRFSLDKLVGSRDIAAPFRGGLCLILRLCPADYHRFCFIERGRFGAVLRTGGAHYSVSPLAQRLGFPIFTDNYRTFCLIDTDRMGMVLQMEVGSFSVGKIALHDWHGGVCDRGQEKGWFEFGASTIVVLIPPGRVAIDDDIVAQSRQHIETLVKMGESIGTFFSDQQG